MGEEQLQRLSIAEKANNEVLEVGVAIAGAGLGGLALAIGLHERGIDAHVFEAAPKLRTDSATIVTLSTNGRTALEGIQEGLAKAVENAGSLAAKVVALTIKDGALASRREVPAPDMLSVLWRSTQEVLAAKLPQDAIHCSRRFHNYTPIKGGVEAEFEVPEKEAAKHHYVSDQALSGSGDTVERGGAVVKTVKVRAKLLVGADGVNSAVRKVLAGDAPEYTGDINFNAIIHDPSGTAFKHHGKDEIHMFNDPGHNMTCFLIDAGFGWTFWNVRKLDPDNSLSDALGKEWGGLGKPGAKERALSQLKGEGEGWDYLRAAIQGTPEEVIFERRILERRVRKKWSDASGHVVLLGDAAHAMHQGPGEGARQTFEDAHQLSLFLAEEAGRDLAVEGVENAVLRYEKKRVVRCARVQSYAREMSGRGQGAAAYTADDPLKRRQEFIAWMRSYPENQEGVPDSTSWKPLSEEEADRLFEPDAMLAELAGT